MGVEISNFFQVLDRDIVLAGFERVAAAQQQGLTVARIQIEHLLQDVFRCFELAASAQTVGGGGKNLPRLVLFAESNVNFAKAHAHGDILGIHFQDFLENSYRLLEFTAAQKFFRNLQILRPRVVKQALLGIQFREL